MQQDAEHATLRRLESRARFRGSRVLEVGCGNGRVTAMYAHAPRLALAVEPDEDAVRRAAGAVPGVRFLCASGMGLPVAARCFDVVLFTLSLHHHPDPDQALDEAARVLAPQGRVLVLEPAAEGEIQRFCNIFCNEDHRLERAEQALARTGLRTCSHDVFATDWLFEDFDAAARYAFDYYDHPEDPDKRAAMRAFLGPKSRLRPLPMTDTLRLTCLRT